MNQRVGYGTLAIGILLAVFMADVVVAQLALEIEGPVGRLLQRGSILPVLFLVAVLAGARELNRLLCRTNACPYMWFACVMIAVLMLSPWLAAAGWLGSNPREVEGLFWQFIWLIVSMLGAGVCAILRRNPSGIASDVGATLIMIFYLGFLGSFAVQLRCGRDVPADQGAWLLLIVLLLTKASDIGAYFAGSSIGRHKLIPSISPGKTVEGTVAGLLSSAFVACMFSVASSRIGSVGLTTTSSLPLEGATSKLALLISEMTRTFLLNQSPESLGSLIRAAILGLVTSGAGQFGDLFESGLKRHAGAKDSGNMIPQYGGILDLIDSPMYAVPVAWVMFAVVWDII